MLTSEAQQKLQKAFDRLEAAAKKLKSDAETSAESKNLLDSLCVEHEHLKGEIATLREQNTAVEEVLRLRRLHGVHRERADRVRQIAVAGRDLLG